MNMDSSVLALVLFSSMFQGNIGMQILRPLHLMKPFDFETTRVFCKDVEVLMHAKTRAFDHYKGWSLYFADDPIHTDGR
ncbi:hypothetical protein F2Q70_00040045 [Brassica cretica]|uniref:Uncharacterized protein n=1 Tax=Brassica cretica TaxID=69181 RepID=A0A8S9K4R6_BRACR|nr:hypothetical protein F2Q70_00040045 [Brassica cretica]